MRRILAFFLLLNFNGLCQLPDTEIFIADLDIRARKVGIINPKNVTDRKGYDNQPHFTPKGDKILFTSIREKGQADIFQYDLKSGNTTQITSSEESEYSPTIIPGSSAISVVRVEKDSTQRLWKFNNGNFSVILPGFDSIGYHCWTDSSTLMLFKLGSPFTLWSAEVTSGKIMQLDTGIGRGMAVHNNRFYYIQKSTTPSIYSIKLSDMIKGKPIPALEGSEDFVICGNYILMAKGSKIYKWSLTSRKKLWEEVADFSSMKINNITRLAVNKQLDKIAIVSNQVPPK